MFKKSFVVMLTIMMVLSFSTVVFASPDAVKSAKAAGTEQTKALTVQEETGNVSMMMAAPGITAQILEYNGVNARYGKGKAGGNFIADVAAQMGPGDQFAGIRIDAPGYGEAVLSFLNNHPMMTNTLVMPVNTLLGNVVTEDFGVMDISGVKGYTVGFGLTDATAADVQQVVIKLYNGTTVLGTVTSSGVLTNYATATSLSAPFDVLGTFNYVTDGNWTYSGWVGNTSVIPTKAEITVTFKNGLVKTAVNENLTGDTSIFAVHLAPVLVNGGFETPVITIPEGWNTFPSTTEGLGWTVAWMDASDVTPALLEMQTASAVNLIPDQGNQYAELDSFNSTIIYQDINTYQACTYTLSFAIASRNTDSNMEVWWNGGKLATLDNSNAGWVTHTFTDLAATGTTTRLEFREVGTSDGYGMFLDDVTVGF